MIKKKMEEALNKQINEEMYSAYFYLAMVSYCEKLSLKGFAHWLKAQVQEEMSHVMKFHGYIYGRGGEVKLEAIAKPQKEDWDSPLQLFQEALKHEEHISQCINNLMDVAVEIKDYASRNMLNWFVDEQVEEEETFCEIVEKLKMIGDNKAMLLMLDGEMQQRQPGINPFFAPTDAA
jgi:ferritin